MAVNKVQLGDGTTIIDLTGDTISAGDALVGVSLHLASGEAVTGTLSDFDGATASTAGAHGLVPAPAAGDQEKFLRGDGTWQTAGGSSATAMTEAEIQAAFDDGWVTSETVTVSLTYPESASSFASCYIYSAQGESLIAQKTLLTNIDNAYGSADVTLDRDRVRYLIVVCNKKTSPAASEASISAGSISCTGNIWCAIVSGGQALFVIKGSGTITIASVNYTVVASGGGN